VRGDASRADVAFTFDAGSDAGSTTRILTILATNDIHASFGITGEWARANPATLRAIANAGHQIMNHSDSHDSFTGTSTHRAPLSTTERIAQARRGERAISDITGVNPKPWFRAPYGDMDAAGDATLGLLGYRYDVLWTVDSLGWKGKPAREVAQRCIAGAVNGAIYLFHVGSASTDVDALQAIIDGLRAKGFAIGPVTGIVH
jgi:peptidoglycan/xylan/chitin deacetylase (PgdA/CDA1 family)